MKQKLLNKLWLRVGMIVAIMTTALAGTAWAESVTKTGSYNFTTSGCDGWTTDNAGSYCGGFGRNKNGAYYVANSAISNFSDVDFNSVSGASVTIVVKALTNSGTNEYTVSLINSSGSVVGTPVTKTGGMGNGSNAASAQESSVTLTPVAGTTGYRIDFLAKSAITATSYTLTYTESSSSLTSSDLAITGAPVALSFDLYNNDSAQTVSFTSSSSGAVTVSGGTGYVTTSVSGNTITVTPVAVTPSAQTITVFQEEDDTYAAGSKTFTVTVTDSTPFAGGDVTFDATKEKGTSPLVKNGVTFECDNGVLDNGSEYRLYKNSVTTFSVTEGAITQIVFTGVSGNPASGFASQTGWTTDGYNGTWTGNASSVSFTASGAQVRATEIVVTVDMSATPDPVINADNVNIAYNATSGTIEYTIDNPVAGASFSASTTDSWLTLGTETGSTVPFTCSANDGSARTATVTLTYTYNTNETVTKNVTVTQAANPNISTIPALFAKATEVGSTATDVLVTFDSWVVSGVSTNGKNVFVTDNSGNGFVIYYGSDMSNTFAAGNILSGTAVSCKVQLYNGFAEVTNLDASGLTITTGGTVSTANIALADLSGVHTGALVHYENLTCSINNNKYYLSDGTTTLQVYNALFAFDALEDGKTYNITGIYQQYNSTKEILPRSAADIVEVQVQHNEYTLTVSTLTNVEMFVFDATDQSNALIDGESSAQVYDGTQVLISVSAEAGYELESLIVDGNDVTSEIVSDAYTFTMPTHAVTVTATAVAVTPVTNKTLTNANIVAAGDAANSYSNYSITDENGKTWNAYAIKNQHSNATSGYHYLQIKKYASNTAYYLQVPEYGTKITSITMTVSSTQKPMTDGENTATLFFSNSNSTSAAGEGVASGTGASEVTIDCSSLNLNTGYITASAGVRIWDVTVVYEYAPSTITLNASGYATFASTSVVDFTDAETNGYSAWAVTDVSGSEITFSQITGAVPAGTGVLLKGEASAPVTLSYTTSGTAVAGNKLVGITAETPIAANQYYGLSGTSFVKVNAGTVKAGKALLPASVVNGTEVKALTFVFEDDDATGLERVQDVQDVQGAIYNLAGQRLNKMQKGINIVNGKKILK